VRGGPLAKADDSMYIIWPEYFDSNLSKSRGRRVPKNLSVPSPDIEDIFKIAKKMGLSPVLEKEKSHPSRWIHNNGRIKVSKRHSKTQVLKMIGESLARLK
jgi:signal recognition particle subunit SRP19